MDLRADFARLRGRQAGWARRATGIVAAAASLSLPALAGAGQPFIWDDDNDKIDDRMETVQLLGWRYSFENADTTLRQRFVVLRGVPDLVYGAYVLFTAPPSPTDLLTLTTLGMPVLHRFESVPAVRTVATFAQAQAAAALLQVVRVEAIPILYSQTREDDASIGARDPSGEVFPTWASDGGGGGDGIVVGILDTGVNDEAVGPYPGHESLAGRALGGAEFTHGDSALDTPRDGSVNPTDTGGSVTGAHGTHVAGIILGTGGESGYAIGVAPAARFVDVKVIGDTGVGTGVAEALDWCIHNRGRDWGAGPPWTGIDVINLSLSSLDQSDGNDVASQIAARAVQLGITVVASMGNDGRDHFVPSPAGGDGVLAVGAYDAQRTGRADDDQFAAFSNYGPRASDGDGDAFDEQKPDLLAPGVAVLSADGDLASDGAQYRRMSGTSMSAAFVSGAAAALRGDYPSLTPAQIATLLRSTARRSLAAMPAGVGGPDPRWLSPRGWGALDLFAARLELTQPERSQIRRLTLAPNASQLDAHIWTQRERGASFFVLERAADAGGVPGAFAPLDSAAAAGDSSLTLADLHDYALSLPVAPAERGVPFWYRVAYTEGGVRWSGPSRRVTSPLGESVARFEVRIVHNAYDHDIAASVDVGGTEQAPDLAYPLPGTSAAVGSDWESGTTALGNIAWDFAIDVPAGAADPELPPSPQHPWRLHVTDGGYLNRSGRVESFRVIWHAPGGDLAFDGTPVPLQTIEGGTIEVATPSALTDVPAGTSARAFAAGPNPLRAGEAIWFSSNDATLDAVRIFDLAGREVGHAPFIGSGQRSARWEARNPRGGPLSAGVYFARAGRFSARIVLLTP